MSSQTTAGTQNEGKSGGARSFLALSLALAATLGACQRLETGARETFAKKYSCPEDRVTTQERDDIQPSQIFLTPYKPPKPPADVAADPDRLAKWKSDEAKQRQQRIDSYDHRFNYSITVFEVSGCGHRAMLGCEHPQNDYDADCREGHDPLPSDVL